MAIQWSDFALQSLEEIIIWYELEAGRQVADSIAPGTCALWERRPSREGC